MSVLVGDGRGLLVTPSSGPWFPGISRYPSDSLALSTPLTAEFTPGEGGEGHVSVLGVGQSQLQPGCPSSCLWSLDRFPRAIVSHNCLANVLMHLGGHWEMHVESSL